MQYPINLFTCALQFVFIIFIFYCDDFAIVYIGYDILEFKLHNYMLLCVLPVGGSWTNLRNFRREREIVCRS